MNKKILSLLIILACPTWASHNPLPELGDSTSAYISLEQERIIGLQWLYQKQQIANIINQPFIRNYFENLMYRLLPYADLPQKKLNFIVFDDPTLNASAVPGGIISTNLGLFLYTQDEDEFASIMAHEFAHLGQRHFARHVQAMKNQEPIALAGILASILLIATNNTQAGVATMLSTPAASIQNYLTFSRSFEREADRIGMQTLVKAGMDPYAMPTMFKAMMQSYRYSAKAPEFLQTHPLSNNRMADSANRAENFKAQKRTKGFEFLIIQNFAKIKYRYNTAAAIAYFSALEKQTNASEKEKSAARYSLSSIYFTQKKYTKALAKLNAIHTQFKSITAILTLKAQILVAQKQTKKGIKLLQDALKNRPNDEQIMYYLSQFYLHSNHNINAINYLNRLLKYNSQPNLWKQLSQAYQKAKKPSDSLRALAEYSYTTARYNQALKQLQQALEISKQQKDFQAKASIENRIQEINQFYNQK